MPNPADPPIPRPSSDPTFSYSHCPPSGHFPTASRRKGGRQRSRRHNNTKNSELTRETLQEFNKRNAANEKKNSKSYIDQQKLYSSPGSGSQFTANTSISTVLVRIHEWGTSCFRSKSDKKSAASTSKGKNTSFSSINTITIKEALEMKKKELNPAKAGIVGSSTREEKPLRERVSTAPVIQRPVLVEQKLRVMKEKPKEVTKIVERFVWANTYRPKALKDFICNRDKAEELITSMQTSGCSHYIFEGPHGVGKRTMIWALLRETFGADKLMTREECKEFTLKGETQHSLKVNIHISARHVEVNTSELGGYEKHVVLELIKEKHKMESDQVMQCGHGNCYAIILHEADKLSTDAQLYIRWLMEKNKGCNRIFFCCHDSSKLQTIKSLCKVVQLLPPSNQEIIEVLEFVAKQEQIELPRRLAERIAENSQHNLRQAIRSFEASCKLNYPLTEDQVILTGWEEDITNIAQNIIDEQSPKQLYVIRGKLQSLIEHNVSPDFIFHTLAVELKKLLGENCHSKIDALYQEYNREGGVMLNDKLLVPMRHKNRQSEGKRKKVHQFLRIEEFTAKFMSWYKSSVLSGMNGM